MQKGSRQLEQAQPSCHPACPPPACTSIQLSPHPEAVLPFPNPKRGPTEIHTHLFITLLSPATSATLGPSSNLSSSSFFFF